MNIIEKTRTENAISFLWQLGKSGKEIEESLNIRFTWKNQATGENIPADDISRCMRTGLIGWESLQKSFTDSL